MMETLLGDAGREGHGIIGLAIISRAIVAISIGGMHLWKLTRSWRAFLGMRLGVASIQIAAQLGGALWAGLEGYAVGLLISSIALSIIQFSHRGLVRGSPDRG